LAACFNCIPSDRKKPFRSLHCFSTISQKSRYLEAAAPSGIGKRTDKKTGNALAMIFKLVEAAQKSWRRLDGQSQRYSNHRRLNPIITNFRD